MIIPKNKEERKPAYSRAMARKAWKKLSCKDRNQIKWICDQQDDGDLHAGFAAYKQMM